MNIEITQELIEAALRKIGVQIAGKHDHVSRWSVSDLAKDLYDELADTAEEKSWLDLAARSRKQFADENPY